MCTLVLDEYITYIYIFFISTAGQDYSTVVQQVTIPASTGPSKVCFNINITDDSISEGNEDFLVSFQLPPNSDAVPGPTSSTTVTIVDDDGERIRVV